MPPTNHLANGSSHSQTVCQSFDQVTSSAAWRAQNASKSSSASSYSAVPVTRALAAKSGGGGNVRSSTR